MAKKNVNECKEEKKIACQTNVYQFNKSFVVFIFGTG